MREWDDEADVVVVGFGGAGACAALQAKESGADVLVLDRFHGGGATAISGGVVYAGGTHIQREANVQDDTENMFAYLKQEVKDVVSDETLRAFCEESAGNIRWLEAHGVPFEASLCPFKTSYPLDLYYLYYSGNEGFAPYRDHARPAPRGHRAKGPGLPGQSFYAPLRASAERLGVRTLTEARASRLLTDDEGRVVGVEVQKLAAGAWTRMHRLLQTFALKINHYQPHWAKAARRRIAELEAAHSTPVRIRAKRGVVLATGGFVHNRDMVKEHAPAWRRAAPLGTAGCDGSGILLGASVGGATDRMHRVSGWRFINPPEAFTKGVFVDRKGVRYINERMYGAMIGEKMVEEHGGEGILIIDQTLWKEAREQCKPGRAQWFQRAPALLNLYANCKRGNTIEELAKVARLDEAGLRETLNSYAAAARGEAPDAFGKEQSFLHELKPPFFAINCSIDSKRFPLPTLTLGGLVVNQQDGAVLREDGAPVPGLFAAGRCAVGVCSQQYVSGLSLADCVYAGRRAGRHAATGVPARAETTASRGTAPQP